MSAMRDELDASLNRAGLESIALKGRYPRLIEEEPGCAILRVLTEKGDIEAPMTREALGNLLEDGLRIYRRMREA